MPDAGMIRKEIEARIAELEAIIQPLCAERDQLMSVGASFAARGAAAAPLPTPRTTAGAGAARRARNGAAPAAAPGAPRRGGGRAQQAIELITARPGVTAAELAQSMGISRNYLYRVLPKLEQRGMVRKQGRGYHLA